MSSSSSPSSTREGAWPAADRNKATKDDSWDMACKEMLSGSGENSKNCSVEFKDAKSTMDEYEKMFFSNENRADRLFPEIDPRFHQKKFEKENSWEPSVVEMERQPSPERTQSNMDESMRTSTPKKRTSST
ncbi:unnamed protein product [Caenorhabditis angaria]|uniref:Uncharacterized protein n=1 Tax=Caenorhabditis angaria TaxID=860376 RepID=A0A9P1ILY4_9PELO|nr:unnamed protein product [Caenorhabditis angaria]